MVTQSDAAEDKHAFLVMAYKDDETLRGLLRILDDERNDLFIHMDAKNTGWVDSRTLASVGKAGIVSVPCISVTWGATRRSPASPACSAPPLPGALLLLEGSFSELVHRW